MYLLQTIRFSLFALCFLFVLSSEAEPRRGQGVHRGSGRGGGCSWGSLEKRQAEMGLSAERTEAMLTLCRESGFSAEEAAALMEPVLMANQEGLSSECVFVKVKEGLAKGADYKEIVAVAQRRLACLQQARNMLNENAMRGSAGRGSLRLEEQVCFTLESGLPKKTIQAVLHQTDGRRYGRLLQVLEVGETMQLAGFAPDETQRIMEDCLSRQLRPDEMQRALSFLLQEHRKGRDFKSIYAGLWTEGDVHSTSGSKSGKKERSKCDALSGGGVCPVKE